MHPFREKTIFEIKFKFIVLFVLNQFYLTKL